jgi:hypothetical protein
LNGTSYAVINNKAQFDAVSGNLSGNYVLGSDIANLSFSDFQAFGLATTNLNINVSLPSPAGTSAVGALAGAVLVSGTANSIVYNVYSAGTLTSGQQDANGNFITGTGFVNAGGLIGRDIGNSSTPVINTVTNAFSTVNVFSNALRDWQYRRRLARLSDHCRGGSCSCDGKCAGWVGRRFGGWDRGPSFQFLCDRHRYRQRQRRRVDRVIRFDYRRPIQFVRDRRCFRRIKQRWLDRNRKRLGQQSSY